MDPNAATPINNIICQYIVGIISIIALLVYARTLITLQNAINVAKNIEIGIGSVIIEHS